MEFDSHSDRNWAAFRFVAGEMTDEERRLYELRLADDEAACDAVEQAVELYEAIRPASREPIVVRPTRWGAVSRHPAAWASVAACLVLAVSVWQFSTVLREGDSRANTSGPRQQMPGDTEAGVSLAWAELQSRSLCRDDEPAASPWFSSAEIPKLEDLPLIVEHVEAVDATVPQWLMTAVSSGAEQVKETP